MLPWWKKKLPLTGLALFRGNLPVQPDDFNFLSNYGVTVSPSANNTRTAWALELSHPNWGNARLSWDESVSLPPREIYEFAFIPVADRDAAVAARSGVFIRMDAGHEHVLQDRKMLLRYLRAVMGDDGVVGMDCLAQKVWTRDALDDELCHNADLDVEGIIDIHAVKDDNDSVFWVHSHGLAEIGAFDFDIFGPSSDVLFNIGDLTRAVAFSILEGELDPSTSSYCLMHPRGNLRLVDINTFLANVDPAVKDELNQSVSEDHRQKRYVLCEPEGSSLMRLFGKAKLRPARFLTEEIPEEPMFSFSTNATNLMAQRARNTYPMLRALRDEFNEFDFQYAVKLGIQVDGGDKENREHMWFAVHELHEDSIDATLMNQPYYVERMKEGDRGRHSIELISDWMVVTPVGFINPRSTAVARMIRANADAIRKMMEEHKCSGHDGCSECSEDCV